MKQVSLTKAAIATATFACAALFSFGWSEQRGVSISVESAEARVGRPLTPVSVAGVARRQDRRADVGPPARAARQHVRRVLHPDGLRHSSERQV